MKTRRLQTPALALMLTSVVALASLSGCGARPQFAGEFFYGNLMHDNASNALRSVVFEQLTDSARAAGLDLVEQDATVLRFKTQAPNWTGKDANGDDLERADPRRIMVEVELGGVHGLHTYRYRATIAGEEPGGFTDEARARLGRALVALREVFERPLDRDFFPAEPMTTSTTSTNNAR